MHTISFQTFFVWALEIVVYSWKFRILLLCILWDDRPIFMISGSNEKLQQQLEYVVYWLSTWPNMPFQRRGICIFHWCRWAWLTIWDKVKSHGTVRLMHWKRVTCELHDSYFHSMTIKHAIPRTAEVIYPDGQLWGDIEWAIELLYNSVKTGSPLVWRPDLLVTRCGRESQHLAEWAPWRTRKTQRW